MTSEKVLKTKPGIFLELLLFFSICLFPIPLGIIILLVVCLSVMSLKTRKQTWKEMGFSMDDFKLPKIVLGLVLTIIYLLIFQFLIGPVLDCWLPKANLQALGIVKKDIGKLAMYLLATWTMAAFGEELIFRGYLVSRLMDLLGNTPPARLTCVFLSSIPFAFVHTYQGVHGMITAGILGIFQSIVYLVDKKKLVIPIVVHGSFDTVGFISLFT